jgi:hypothetical protein
MLKYYIAAAMVLSFLISSINAGAEEQAPTVGQLLSQGYEIKAAIAGAVVLQKGDKAYVCDFTMDVPNYDTPCKPLHRP